MSGKKTQLWCLYGAYAFAVLFLIGWVGMAGFVPPLSPAVDAGHTAAFYQGNLLGIRLGMLMSLFASALPLAWDGILGFWLPVTLYFVWLIVTTVLTAQAVERDDEALYGYDELSARMTTLERELALIKATQDIK